MKGWLRGRILDPLLRLLQQGVSSERLALCVAIGVVVGNIPILGTSTILCAAIDAGFAWILVAPPGGSPAASGLRIRSLSE